MQTQEKYLEYTWKTAKEVEVIQGRTPVKCLILINFLTTEGNKFFLLNFGETADK
jgi:hypothetical protein